MTSTFALAPIPHADCFQAVRHRRVVRCQRVAASHVAPPNRCPLTQTKTT